MTIRRWGRESKALADKGNARHAISTHRDARVRDEARLAVARLSSDERLEEFCKMKFGLEPIAHISPRPRIETNPYADRPRGADPHDGKLVESDECARIWDLLKNAAEGA